MKDERRSILKQLLAGHLAGPAGASQLKQALRGGLTPCVAISFPDGLYTFGEERGLTKEQVRQRATGAIFFIPDNGRD